MAELKKVFGKKASFLNRYKRVRSPEVTDGVYEGETKDGKPNGKGKLITKSWDIFECQFDNDNMIKGKLTYSDDVTL